MVMVGVSSKHMMDTMETMQKAILVLIAGIDLEFKVVVMVV